MKKFICKIVLNILRKNVKETYYASVLQRFKDGLLIDEQKILRKRIPTFEESYHFPSLAIKFIAELNEGIPTDFKKDFHPPTVETIGEIFNDTAANIKKL